MSKGSDASMEELLTSAAPTSFYEGKWVNINAGGRLKDLLIKKQRFFLRHLRDRQGSLLDLGCGGGWQFLQRFDPVIGLDLSHASLQQACRVYSGGVLGTIVELPFEDGTFDIVVSQDVLGHIPASYKDDVLSEILRILKPGGLTLHYIETLSTDPLSTFARQHSELYERHFVLPEGHIGLESPQVTFDRFRRAGFTPVSEISAYKGLIYSGRIVQYFDNEYREKSVPLDLLVGTTKRVRSIPGFGPAIDLALTFGFELFDPILPDAWAGGVLVAYQKDD